MKRLLRIMLGPVAHACAALLLAAIVCCPASAQTPPPSAPAPAAAAAGPRQAEPQAPAVAPANEPASPPTSAAAQLPRDLSPWGMFLSADIVVKAVMIGLAFASFVTWTIALAKTLEIFAARRPLRSKLFPFASLFRLLVVARPVRLRE